jgi:hypothetical protein
MDKVLAKIEVYKQSLAKITENRKIWSDRVKQLIYDTLLKVKKASDLDWHVQKVEGLTNLEAINISFNNQGSGLIETTNTGRRHNVKHGGALIFTQAYNGQIFIIYTYPYIDNWVGQLDNKLIDKVEPEKISEEFVLNQVAMFLEEMSKWESSTTKTQIGFTTER